jgi:hypothetical protein
MNKKNNSKSNQKNNQDSGYSPLVQEIITNAPKKKTKRGIEKFLLIRKLKDKYADM